MDFSTVVKSFRSIDIEQVRLDAPGRDLWSVQQITLPAVDWQPDILYLGRLSQLSVPSETRDGPVSLILLKDCALTDAPLAFNALNLALLPEKTELQEIYSRLQSVFLDSSRIISGMGVLFDALLEDRGLQQLAEAAARVFRMSVMITDSSYKYLAWARGSADTDGLAEEITRSGYMADTLVHEIQVRQIDEIIRRAGRPTLVQSGHGGEYLVAPVVVHDAEVAHVSLLTSGQAVGSVERELLRRFAQIVANELQKSSFFRVNRGTLHSAFLADLFESRINTLIDVRKRLAVIGFTLKSHQQVLSVSIRDHIASDSRLQAVMGQLRKLLPDSIQMIYQGNIVLLLSRGEPAGLNAQERAALEQYLAGQQLIAGLSRTFVNILDIQRHYQQACKATAIEPPAGFRALRCYEDLVVFHIAEMCQDRVQLLNLCHPAVLQLRQIDARQGTALAATLRVHLRYARNPSRAAAELAIHRNTLFYRIARIGELTGLDFENGDILMQVILSFQILDYLERGGAPAETGDGRP